MPFPTRVADMTSGHLPDAVGLLDSMQRGERSSEQIVTECLNRLASTHGSLNAATHVFREEALAEARNPRPGRLSGLPVSVKETFGLSGSTVTAGSVRMREILFGNDAEAVRRLRDAGAIVIARSNVPEFAMAGETESPRYGVTRNPLNPSRTCGGSSGGEAALVASGASAAGLGSDILGSIRIPASFCGLVGFKPASEAVSKAGSWPDLAGHYTDSWLCIGPIVRSVRDARLMYEVLTGREIASRGELAGVRLVVPAEFPLSFRDDSVRTALELARSCLLDAGLEPESPVIGDVRRWYRDKIRFLSWELLPLLEGLLAEPAGGRISLAREAMRRWRGRSDIYDGLYRLLVVGRLARYRSAKAAERCKARIEAARASVRQLLGDDAVMLLPTLGTLAPPHGEMNRLSLKAGVNGLFTPLTLCNYLNLPAVTVPAWRCRDAATGLVPGVMLVGSPGHEALLLDVAERLERVVGRASAEGATQ